MSRTKETFTATPSAAPAAVPSSEAAEDLSRRWLTLAVICVARQRPRSLEPAQLPKGARTRQTILKTTAARASEFGLDSLTLGGLAE